MTNVNTAALREQELDRCERILTHCMCHEDYKARDRIDPQCQACDLGREVIDSFRAMRSRIAALEAGMRGLVTGEVSAGYDGPSVVFPASGEDDRILSGMVGRRVYAHPPTIGQQAVDGAMVARFIEAATKQGFLHLRGTAVERSVHNLLTAALAQQTNKEPHKDAP